MRGHIEAVKTLLEATGREVYVSEVTGAPTFPYFLLWTSTGRERTESLADVDDYLDDVVYVTTAGLTGESVMTVAADHRAVLRRRVLDVDGWATEPLRLEADVQPIVVDRDVTIPGTNLHPKYGVDGYRLVAQPTPEEEDET